MPSLKTKYLKSLLHRVAPHFFVMLRLGVHGIHDHEGEVSVVDLLLERLDEGGTVARFHIFLVGVLNLQKSLKWRTLDHIIK